MALSESHADFAKRLKVLDRKHEAMNRGYTTRVRDDGLIVIKPRRRGPTISPRIVLSGVFCFFAFKAFMLSAIGPEGYGERVALLQAGTPVEQAGAWAMQADPLTQFMAETLGPVFR